MPQVRNVSTGARHVPLLGRVFEPGEAVDLPDEEAALLDGHPDFARVPEPKVDKKKESVE